ISGIRLMFDLPWTSRADFIYTTVLGGPILPTAPYSATIERDGSVIYIPTPRQRATTSYIKKGPQRRGPLCCACVFATRASRRRAHHASPEDTPCRGDR